MTAVAVPLPRWQHSPASYTELRRGDRIQVPRVYHGQVADWLWRHLLVDHVQWISEGALLLWLTEPAPCGDRFLLIVGDAIAAGVRVLTPKEPAMSDRADTVVALAAELGASTSKVVDVVVPLLDSRPAMEVIAGNVDGSMLLTPAAAATVRDQLR